MIGLRSVVRSSDNFPQEGSSLSFWGDGRWLGKRVAIESGNSKAGGGLLTAGAIARWTFLNFVTAARTADRGDHDETCLDC